MLSCYYGLMLWHLFFISHECVSGLQNGLCIIFEKLVFVEKKKKQIKTYDQTSIASQKVRSTLSN